MAKKAATGHNERVITGYSPEGKAYWGDRWVIDHPEELEEGPPASFPEGSTAAKPEVVQQVSVGSREGGRFFTTNAEAYANAAEKNREAAQATGEKISQAKK